MYNNMEKKLNNVVCWFRTGFERRYSFLKKRKCRFVLTPEAVPVTTASRVIVRALNTDFLHGGPNISVFLFKYSVILRRLSWKREF